MDWLDISVPIRAGMIVFEGDPAVRLERTLAIADGGVCNLSRLVAGVHSGTHVDAPLHFIDGAPGIEAVPLDALVGRALVVDASDVVDGEARSANLDAAMVDRLGIPAGTQRLLLRTANSALWDLPGFSRAFVGLTANGARRLVELGVRLVGIDYLSVAPYGDPTPTHRALLDAGVVIVEGLDLRAAAPGPVELVCLPILIPGSDGAPARALIRRIAEG